MAVEHIEKLQPARGGWATRFPGKTKLVAVRLTAFADNILRATTTRTGLTQGDVVESLLRKFAGRL